MIDRGRRYPAVFNISIKQLRKHFFSLLWKLKPPIDCRHNLEERCHFFFFFAKARHSA